MKNKKLKYLIPLLCLAGLQFACREEIISPKNNSGNINEPFKSSHTNSYTFIINAERISQKIIDYPRISYFNTRIFISFLDFSAGSVEISVLSNSNEVLFKRVFVETNDGLYSLLQGVKPHVVEINFINFTGKLKFQLTGIL